MAVDRGTRVHPFAWMSAAAGERAREMDAVCAVGRTAAGPGRAGRRGRTVARRRVPPPGWFGL